MSGRSRLERVRERREPEARSQLLGDRRAADEVPALEDQRAQAGLGEVRAVRQAVVAAADDDRVVGPVGLRRSWPAGAYRAGGAASGLLRVFGMSGGPSLGVEQRRAGDDRIEVVVAVVDGHLELHPRARRRPVERHAGERDVALEHRRVHLAGRVAELVEVVVVDVVLVLDRRVVLGRDEPRLVVDPIVVAPVDDEPAQLPARGLAGQLAADRVAPDELAIGGRRRRGPSSRARARSGSCDRRRSRRTGSSGSRRRGGRDRPRCGPCTARSSRSGSRPGPGCRPRRRPTRSARRPPGSTARTRGRR